MFIYLGSIKDVSKITSPKLVIFSPLLSLILNNIITLNLPFFLPVFIRQAKWQGCVDKRFMRKFMVIREGASF